MFLRLYSIDLTFQVYWLFRVLTYLSHSPINAHVHTLTVDATGPDTMYLSGIVHIHIYIDVRTFRINLQFSILPRVILDADCNGLLTPRLSDFLSHVFSYLQNVYVTSYQAKLIRYNEMQK